MKKIILFQLILFCAIHHTLWAQCPAIVPTFSTYTPNSPGGDLYVVNESVVNSDGNLAVVGVRKDINTGSWSIYFAVYDPLGNMIVSPKDIAMPVGLNIFDGGYAIGNRHNVFITEALDANGNADGYMFACNIHPDFEYFNEAPWIAHLTADGNVLWGSQLGLFSDNYPEKVVEIIRKNDDEYIILVDKGYSPDHSTMIYKFNRNGTSCSGFETHLESMPAAMVKLTSGVFGSNAEWAVCLNANPLISGSYVPTIEVALLDNNFAEINTTSDLFKDDLAHLSGYEVLDITELNGNLFISGIRNQAKGFLIKLSPEGSGATLNDLQYSMSVEIDIPDDPFALTQTDIPWDLETRGDRIAVGGWTDIPEGENNFKHIPWLLTFDENLVLQKSKTFSFNGSPYGLVHKVVQQPNGYFVTGSQWDEPFQTDGSRGWIAACDQNAVIGDCICLNDLPVNINPLMGGLIDVRSYTTTLPACTPAQVNATVQLADNTTASCFPLPPSCSVSIISSTSVCNTTANLTVNTAGFGGPLSYSWSAPAGFPSSGSGSSFVTAFPSTGSYTVCVTVTDGMCTENACVVVDILPDQILPTPICNASLTLALDAFGTAFITVNAVNNGSFDNCSLTLTLDKFLFDCSDLGSNTVTLTAIDNYGNTDFCQTDVIVQDLIAPIIDCPASLTVNGIEDANHNCNINVNNIAATATDNCPPATISYVLSGATTGSGNGDASGTLFFEGVTTVTYTATDASGNMDNCDFTVTVLPCNQIDSFEKLYGDTEYNEPTKIKAFGNYVYLAGKTVIGGTPYATFTKFDPATADVVWDIRLNVSSTITDFEYIPATESNTGMDGFILVGRTEPFDNGTAQNNNSIILRIDDLGATAIIGSFNKLYQLTGRETFTRIVKHPYPVDINYPYYVAGSKNPPSSPAPPSSADIIILMNIDQNGNEKFFVEYDYAAPDDEFARGMFPLNNGNLMLTGNDSPAGNGMLVEVNGLNGATTSNTYILESDFDVYDGIQLPTGEMIIVGADFGLNVAFAAEVLPGFGAQYVVRFPEIIDFREIGMDALGRLYTVGKVKAGTSTGVPGRQAIHRLIAGSGGSNFITLDSPETWYLEDLNAGEFAWENPHIYVSPQYDKIFYADGRIGTNPYTGLGDYDMLVGAYGLDDLATPAPEDCHFTIHEIPFQHGFTPIAVPVTAITSPHATSAGPGVFGVNLVCHDFCSQPCLADFTWGTTGNCYEIAFSATATGTGPYTYAWDINCDGIADVPPIPAIADPVYTFPSSGTYLVCLIVTDAAGCQAEVSMMVTVPPDNQPPVITCPADITVGTDPGVCYSFQSLMATATDNCPPVTITYLLNPGGGTNPATNYPLGDTEVTATATDQAGLTADCTFTVTVIDDEDPIVDCPENIFAYVAACEQGLAISFPPATATDNCTPFTLSASCNLPSGYFFPCGSTTVNCTATDASGNVGNCSFNVYVNCECMSFANGTISCNASNPKVYEFSLDINNLTGGSSCNITIDNNQSGVTMIYNPPIWNIGQTVAAVTGYFYVTDPVPNPLELEISMTCSCPNGQTESCSLLYTFTPPCCEEVVVTDRNICYNADTVLVVLENCDNLYGVTQVNWYWGPCGAIPSTPKQVTTGCEPLLLLPSSLDDDICVYAKVFLNGNPCTMLTSNTATITLCQAISCSVNMVEECDALVPTTPDPLELTLSNADCIYTIEWIDPSGVVVQNGGLTYQPPPLDYTGGPDDCYQDFIYTVRISNDCETTTCTGTVRFYNNDAPKGTIILHAPDLLPVCWGDDLELEYIPDCTEEPPAWYWYSSLDGAAWFPIPGSGMSNAVYNTNELYDDGSVDTWFQVQSMNGICPADTVNFQAIIRQPLVITDFTAAYTSCDQETVQLSLDYNNSINCSDTIEWYHNGILLGYENNPSLPVTYDYTPVLPDRPEGYYYAVVKSCCGEKATTSVIEILPPVYIEMSGPCFRCNADIVTITGEVMNLPSGTSCTYSWTASGGGHIVSGETTTTIVVDASGLYTFEATCDGCTYTAMFDLLQCGDPTGTEDPAVWNNGYARLYPNPTNGRLTIEFITGIPAEGSLVITDVLGRIVGKQTLDKDIAAIDLSITRLPAGIYFIKVLDGDVVVWMEKVVKG